MSLARELGICRESWARLLNGYLLEQADFAERVREIVGPSLAAGRARVTGPAVSQLRNHHQPSFANRRSLSLLHSFREEQKAWLYRRQKALF